MAAVHTFLYRPTGVSFSFFFVTSFCLVSELCFSLVTLWVKCSVSSYVKRGGA